MLKIHLFFFDNLEFGGCGCQNNLTLAVENAFEVF